MSDRQWASVGLAAGLGLATVVAVVVYFVVLPTGLPEQASQLEALQQENIALQMEAATLRSLVDPLDAMNARMREAFAVYQAEMAQLGHPIELQQTAWGILHTVYYADVGLCQDLLYYESGDSFSVILLDEGEC